MSRDQPLGHATRRARPAPYGPFDETFMREYAEMFYQHRIPQNMVSTSFQDTFGQHPTPLREALRDTIDWYRHYLTRT